MQDFGQINNTNKATREAEQPNDDRSAGKVGKTGQYVGQGRTVEAEPKPTHEE